MGEVRSEATSARLLVIVLSSMRSLLRSSRPSLLAWPHLQCFQIRELIEILVEPKVDGQ